MDPNPDVTPDAPVSTTTGPLGLQFAEQYPLRILVAEDNSICLRVLVMFLKTLGYSPTCAEDGRACLQEAMAKTYDLILTDLDMPGMTGIECTKEIRRQGLTVFIVAVTAGSATNTEESCRKAGMNGYLKKPFNATTLKEKLREAFAASAGKCATA